MNRNKSKRVNEGKLANNRYTKRILIKLFADRIIIRFISGRFVSSHCARRQKKYY